MPFHKISLHTFKRKSKARKTVILVIALILLLSSIVLFFVAQKRIYDSAKEQSIYKASAIISASVGGITAEKLTSGNYSYEYFVDLQKNNLGNIIAISANAANISDFSDEISNEINGKSFSVIVHAGDFSHLNCMHGKGIEIPVTVTLNNTSTNYNNRLEALSENQIKHEISLNICVPFEVSIGRKTVFSEIHKRITAAEIIIINPSA